MYNETYKDKNKTKNDVIFKIYKDFYQTKIE